MSRLVSLWFNHHSYCWQDVVTSSWNRVPFGMCVVTRQTDPVAVVEPPTTSIVCCTICPWSGNIVDVACRKWHSSVVPPGSIVLESVTTVSRVAITWANDTKWWYYDIRTPIDSSADSTTSACAADRIMPLRYTFQENLYVSKIT